MDRRGWPWKKKSSDKNIIGKSATASYDSDSSVGNGNTLSLLASMGDQESCKKVNYVQITMDTYTHLTGLEDQVKELKNLVRLSEDEVKDLKEKIESSEDEVKDLKEKIESSEDEVRDLMDNIKFSEDEVKGLKEKISEANFEMNNKDGLIKQHVKVAEEAVSGWEKADAEALALKRQLESVTLLKLTAEDKASHLDGALKECTRQIRNVREENELKLQEAKTKLEATIQEFDRKFLQAAAENALLLKSLEERSDVLVKISEEKLQCQAENEYLKANIESCEQEIKSLKYELHVVSKEVDIRNEEKNMGLRSAEVSNRKHLEDVKYIAKLEAECQRLRGLVRKKLPGPAAMAQMKLEVENLGSESQMQKSKAKNHYPYYLSPSAEIPTENSHKQIEFLTSRLLAMEEEAKILKEALATRNNELRDSRNALAKALKRLEALNHQQSSPKLNFGILTEVSWSRCKKNPRSCTSVSEDGFDEERSSTESWTPTTTDRCNSIENSNKSRKSNNLELMDDFLEMERLASSVDETVSVFSASEHSRSSKAKDKSSVEAVKIAGFPNEQSPTEPDTEGLALLSAISMILKSQIKDIDMEKVLEQIKRAMTRHTVGYLSEGPRTNEGFCYDQRSFQKKSSTADQNLTSAVSQIHDFVLLLGKEAVRVLDSSSSDGHGLAKNLDDLSTTFNGLILNKESLTEYVLELSHIFGKFKGVNFLTLNRDANACDYVDKVTLLENKVSCTNGCGPDPEVFLENSAIPSFMSDISPCKCTLEDFRQLKLEKDKLADKLVKCGQEKQEMEQSLGELKRKLDLSEKQCSLVETQLKCMTESYKLIEIRARELEFKVKLLEEKRIMLENDLLEEKQNRQDALGRCKDLQDKLQRNDNCPTCSSSFAGDSDEKPKQENDVVTTSKKLAKCQETINILRRQLKYLRSQKETSTCQHVE